MRSDHVEASGETADPVVRKARRAHGEQAHMNYESPGVPSMPMRGTRRNGSLGREGTAATPSSAPKVARRRGAR